MPGALVGLLVQTVDSGATSTHELAICFIDVFDAVVHYFSLMSLSMIQEVVHVV